MATRLSFCDLSIKRTRDGKIATVLAVSDSDQTDLHISKRMPNSIRIALMLIKAQRGEYCDMNIK